LKPVKYQFFHIILDAENEEALIVSSRQKMPLRELQRKVQNNLYTHKGLNPTQKRRRRTQLVALGQQVYSSLMHDIIMIYVLFIVFLSD